MQYFRGKSHFLSGLSQTTSSPNCLSSTRMVSPKSFKSMNSGSESWTQKGETQKTCCTLLRSFETPHWPDKADPGSMPSSLRNKGIHTLFTSQLKNALARGLHVSALASGAGAGQYLPALLLCQRRTIRCPHCFPANGTPKRRTFTLGSVATAQSLLLPRP